MGKATNVLYQKLLNSKSLNPCFGGFGWERIGTQSELLNLAKS